MIMDLRLGMGVDLAKMNHQSQQVQGSSKFKSCSVFVIHFTKIKNAVKIYLIDW